MIEIDCEVQNYSWGKKGRDSIVATLKENSSSTFALSESQTYAELWMGTHPSGPAKLRNSSTLLSQWIKQHTDVVGVVPTGYRNDDLPFLFKILSVQTALSIQAHPDKELAKKLFAQFPDVYKDDNHKPEMTIALTDFECLCGFRNVKDIQDNFKRYPELLALISSTAPELDCCSSPKDTKEWIKALFGAYMNASDHLVQEHLGALVSRLRAAADTTSLDELILRLEGQYPGDKGVFAPCLLNHLCLAPGESFFIGANEPHAYLSGDCVECMALSDNVVRAGLTPKFKDVHTLCDMLHYNCGPPVMLQPLALDRHSSVYRPPLQSCAEFEVEVCQLPAHTSAYYLPGGNYASLVVATQGDGAVFSLADQSIAVTRGTVLFLAADSKVVVSTEDEEIVFYRAHINCSTNL